MIRTDLDVLLDKVSDTALRADLKEQVEKFQARRNYGLVFESHLPERVRLPEHAIRRGVRVTLRDQGKAPTFEVLAVNGQEATVLKVRQPDGTAVDDNEAAEVVAETSSLESLVVIADFGDNVYPGLRHLESISRGGDKPAHVVIKGENHHVLEALQFTHTGKVDCIYIDPPYNSGGRPDWKYDNNYVDEADGYRHSKWLAFMERRLKLATNLLNPAGSVLIITIDENEVHRLGLLLEQLFPGHKIQMLTTVTNPKGASLGGDFARVEEHIFVIYFGAAGVRAEVRDMLDERKNTNADKSVKWSSLIRGGAQGIRTDSPGAYYPVFVDVSANRIHSFGQRASLGSEAGGPTSARGDSCRMATSAPQRSRRAVGNRA